MASCERLAAASAGMAEFDWAEHSLEQKLRIPQSEPLGKYIYRQWAVEIGAPTSSYTATLLLQSGVILSPHKMHALQASDA